MMSLHYKRIVGGEFTLWCAWKCEPAPRQYIASTAHPKKPRQPFEPVFAVLVPVPVFDIPTIRVGMSQCMRDDSSTDQVVCINRHDKIRTEFTRATHRNTKLADLVF